MMLLKLFIATLLISLEVNGQFGRNCAFNAPSRPGTSNIKLQIAKNVDDFGLDLFVSLARFNKESVFLSPYGIWSVLTLAYFGSDGETENELARVLGVGSDKKIAHEAKQYLSNLIQAGSRDGPIVRSVDKGYFANDFELDNCLKDPIVNVESINFQAPGTADKINKVVSDITNGKITELVQRSDLFRARFMLMNAVYFKGVWKYFFESKTKLTPFFDEDGETQITNVRVMIIRNERFNYIGSHELQAEMVELPYTGEDYSMYVLLPFSHTDRTLGNLNKINLDSAINKMSRSKMNVALPKFKMEKEYSGDLKQKLSELGLHTLFTPAANLRGFNRFESLLVDTIKTKGTIEVNEQGTLATSATSVIATRTKEVPSKLLILNKPFIFLIRNKVSMTTAFIGTYKDPGHTKTSTSSV